VEKEDRNKLIRIIAAGGMTLIGFFLPIEGWGRLVFYLVPYLLAGADVLWGAIENIFHGEVFDEEFLMSLATIGAFSIGEYPEGALVMILYQLGELLQDMAVEKSRRSVADLMRLKPETVTLLKDGKEEFQTPGSGAADACIYAVLGRDFAKTMLPAAGGSPDIRVSGYICPPANAKGNRSSQYFFLNGRCIKSQLVQAALEQAYRNSLFTGRFPMCVLHITMKPNQVDVNVHPAKTEVRFLQERSVFDAVYRTVLSALQGETVKPQISLPDDGEKAESVPAPAAEKPVFPPVRKSPPAAVRPADTAAAPEKSGPSAVSAKSRETLPSNMPEIVEQLVFRQSSRSYGSPEPVKPLITHRADYLPPEAPEAEVEPKQPEPESPPKAAPVPAPEPVKPPPAPPAAETPLPPYRILGEAFNAYILVECGEELILIDKHAAHERLLFDRLKQHDYPSMGQLLLAPEVVELDAEDKQRLLENEALLRELGIEAEDFGGNSLVVRQLPSGFTPADAAGLLEELSASLLLGRRPGTLGIRDETLATMACKAAVKAGKGSDPLEWKPVVEAVLRGQVKYCPHGRPVTMRLTHHQIDRNFKRC